MSLLRRLRDDRGSTAIEFAIAIPVLISLIWGMFQVSLLLQSSMSLSSNALFAGYSPAADDLAMIAYGSSSPYAM